MTFSSPLKFARRKLARRTLVLSAILLGSSVALAPLAVTPAVAQGAFENGPRSVSSLAKKLLPSVVNISTSQSVGPRSGRRTVPQPRVPDGSPFEEYFEEFFGNRGDDDETPRNPRRRQATSLGSGFVVDAENGIIITNNHVIDGADEITANFSDGSALTAELIGTDPKTDIAVLKVTPETPLVEVPFGQSEPMEIGDWVLAIGNPFGLGGTVTMGIISAEGRDINSGPYDNFIQTDASINRGNSGGPLFNMNGEVIGINTAIISPSGGSIGIGFAIPSDLATNVIDQLREFGETRRGWLGVSIQPVSDEIADSLGMDKARGALIAGITKGGPADGSEIEAGDVVLEFDGKPVDEWRDLPRVVADTPVGKTVDVIIFRKDEEVEVTVTLGRLEDGERLIASNATGSDDETEEEAAISALGMTFGELDDDAREKYGLGEEVEAGVVITAVEEGSVAADKSVIEGSVIVEIGQVEVKTPQDVADRLEETSKAGRKNALFLISSKTGELSFVVLKLDG
ncbi:MAG: Do family serine endopeptidase [Pseudomonadota bacterium]